MGHILGADPIVYCLQQLTDYAQFERLCHDLMVEEGYRKLEPLGGTKDKGRDALHVSSCDTMTAIFAYSVREDWKKKLQEDAEKIKRHGHTCTDLVFCCCENFTAGERDSAIKTVSNEFGWNLHLYGLERFRLLLSTTHQKIVAHHPHIFCPPFFPRAGGLSLSDSRDYLVLDFVEKDEALSTWIARRLMLEGYFVWHRSLSPSCGASLNDTIESLIKHRAFRLLAVLSDTALFDPNLQARRALASTVDQNLVLPLVAGQIDSSKLDDRTRRLEPLRFDEGWASGLKRLLAALEAVACPKNESRAETIVHNSFFPPCLIEEKPEMLFSNRFPILRIPEKILRFTSEKELDNSELFRGTQTWPVRRIDDRRFLSFFEPPAHLLNEYGLKCTSETAWEHHEQIDNIDTFRLISELLRKSVEAICRQRGLKFCADSRLLYFPSGLLKSNRLRFQRVGGQKSSLAVSGRRSYQRGKFYRYALAPSFQVVYRYGKPSHLMVRVRVRLSDDEGKPLQARAHNSRRKHLCKNWWNQEWFDKTIAIADFLSSEGAISLGERNQTVVISSVPESWEVNTSIDDEVVKRLRATHSRDDFLVTHASNAYSENEFDNVA